MATVLIVDDSPVNLTLLESILGKMGCTSVPAASGFEALKITEASKPDIILLDIVMPDLDGIEVCRRLKQNPATAATPVIFITAQDDDNLLRDGFKAGAVDFLRKPYSSDELMARMQLHIEISRLRNNLEVEVAERTRELSEAMRRLELANREVLNRLTLAAEHRDNETANHLKRMSRYSVALGKRAGMAPQRLEYLALASPMHDVGKIGIPDHILLKPGKLTPEEFEVMKTHPQKGANLLAGLDSDLTETARQIALTHHEKFDGSGYPRGLRGHEIPLEGRIVAIADVFDALTSERPYKTAWTIEAAMEYIHTSSGTHFDPELVKCFCEALPEIRQICYEFSD